MAQFIINIIEAARTVDQRDEFSIYDIAGAFLACIGILFIMFAGLWAGSLIGY